MNKGLAATLALALLVAVPAHGQDAAGQTAFADTCGACHMADGSGSPGLAPPLDDAALWQRLGDQSGRYVTGVILSGLTGKIEAGGQTYIGLAMPTHNWLSDDDVVAIASYLLADINALPASVDAALVAEIRAAVPSHGELRTMRKGAQ